jgi:GT2 family glycosyltransferase
VTAQVAEQPALTVASVIGGHRDRARRLLEALARQTAADRLEVVLVDIRPDLGEPDGTPGDLSVRVLPGPRSFGGARAAGARAAHAGFVAFIDEHCYPDPGWAEALLRSWRDGWAALGYSFGNANPGLKSEIVQLANYGEWAAPARGPAGSLPGNNIAYRRERLIALEPRLDELLDADYNLQAQLRRQGHALAIEPGARVLHENEESLRRACQSAFSYSRRLAVLRAQDEGWPRAQRSLRALTIVATSPAARLAGLLGSRHGIRGLLRLGPYLPGILALYLSSAIGESVGYLSGSGPSPERLLYWEVEAPRGSST